MATVRQRKKQARLFSQREFDRAAAEKRITQNTEKLINAAIKQGATPNELKLIFAKEARKAENHAIIAARTDATRIENLARIDMYNETAEFLDDFDVLVVKIWNAVIDGSTRDSHADISGEEQFHDDEFSNGGQYPADPDLPPEERFNCRCWLTTRIEGLEYLDNAEKERLITRINDLTSRILERVM